MTRHRTEVVGGVLKKSDILGYLRVLDAPAVWNRLTVEEQQMGNQALTGCYVRLMDVLETNVLDGDCRAILTQINKREHLNVTMMLPRGDESLEAETLKTAKMLYDHMRGDLVTPSDKSKFLNELETQLKKILEQSK